ncbi:MAG: HAD family hydrolase [Candidatus Anstonellales archaeon]
MRVKKRVAVFLDRDGVINENREGYVKSRDEFYFIPGSLRAMRMLYQCGYLLFIVSNQQGVPKGEVKLENLKEIDKHMEETFKNNGINVQRIYYCLHLESDNCKCRKPKTHFILDAAREFDIDLKHSYVIGDSTKDIKMGRDAGCITVLVRTGLGGRDGAYKIKPHMEASSLLEAAKKITGRN